MKSGGKEMIRALIESGADINVADQEGRTPLHCLQMPQYRLDCENAKDMAKLLIEGGADPEKTDNDGNTPVVCASLYEEV